MQISLSPMRSDVTLTVVKNADVLTINGEAFDFTDLPDGATIPAGDVPCEWIVGPVERVAGWVRLTLVLPHGANPSEAVAFPRPLINPPDGALVLPADEPTRKEVANVEA